MSTTIRHTDVCVISAMDDIYNNMLVTTDCSDAVTYGLRHATDNVRGILERTRSEPTLVLKRGNCEL